MKKATPTQTDTTKYAGIESAPPSHPIEDLFQRTVRPPLGRGITREQAAVLGIKTGEDNNGQTT